MLVLTRKPEQTVQIGDDITVRVVRVKGNTVQLGIEAPRQVRVMRSELLSNSGIEKGQIAHSPKKQNSGSRADEISLLIDAQQASLRHELIALP